MKDAVRTCRKCGEPIAVITWGVYRKAVVDAQAVMVIADADGNDFVRIDGSKIRGRIADYESAAPAEPAYRPHRCGGGK